MSFTKCMLDMHNRNLLYAGKLAIVPLSPPPSQRMDLAHRDFSGGLFFILSFGQEKTRNRFRCGFPCLLSSQLLGVDFGAMMHLKQPCVYVQRTMC
jgi:hypothetical protein